MLCCIYVLNLPQYETDLLKAHDSVTNRLSEWLCCALTVPQWGQCSGVTTSLLNHREHQINWLISVSIDNHSHQCKISPSFILLTNWWKDWNYVAVCWRSQTETALGRKQMLTAKSFLLDLKTWFPPISGHCSSKSRAEMELSTRLIYLTSPGL